MTLAIVIGNAAQWTGSARSLFPNLPGTAAHMNTALESRVRAAGAEMSKPGRWRLALEQLDQATTQILSTTEVDTEAAHLTLDTMYVLYQWSSVMQSHELHKLNSAILRLNAALSPLQ